MIYHIKKKEIIGKDVITILTLRNDLRDEKHILLH